MCFFPRRLITDNVLIAFEIQHYFKRKNRGKKGYAPLKIDMSKAYDMIEWDFLCLMLKKMGFGDKWVNLLISCVKSPTFWVSSEVGLLVLEFIARNTQRNKQKFFMQTLHSTSQDCKIN